MVDEETRRAKLFAMVKAAKTTADAARNASDEVVLATMELSRKGGGKARAPRKSGGVSGSSAAARGASELDKTKMIMIHETRESVKAIEGVRSMASKSARAREEREAAAKTHDDAIRMFERHSVSGTPEGFDYSVIDARLAAERVYCAIDYAVEFLAPEKEKNDPNDSSRKAKTDR